MKTLVCVTPGLFEYKEIPKPSLEKEHALLRIKRIGVCGTDLHAFEGTQPYFSYPRILGHELAAEITAIDGSHDFSPGELVTFIPYFHCGHCIACRNGKTNCCTHLKVCGVHIDGGMAEYFSVPKKYLVHGSGLTADELALAEPLTIGAHGIKRANIQPGEFALIIGAGPIGLSAMAFAKIAGAKVIAMDVNENRLSFCTNDLPVDFTINPTRENATEKLAAITNHDMAAVVIDATGNLKAINNAFQYIAHGGRYILIGLQKGDIALSHPEFHKREAALMSSRNSTKDDFDYVIHAIKNKLVDPNLFITHRIRFDAIAKEFSSLSDPANNVIKAMIELY
ncbi:MAG TPA: zinc-binding alcohol dehydrogenase family protein [Chitinophagaceae bacterium]|nr:zinc-binding alcohol dehydrogenase family protein [Chitinophagaceae bacterium]